MIPGLQRGGGVSYRSGKLELVAAELRIRLVSGRADALRPLADDSEHLVSLNRQTNVRLAYRGQLGGVGVYSQKT